MNKLLDKIIQILQLLDDLQANNLFPDQKVFHSISVEWLW